MEVDHRPADVRTRWRVLCLRLLVVLGIGAFLYFFNWWWQQRTQAPWSVIALASSAVFLSVQFVGNWLLYLATFRRSGPPGHAEVAVDVFVTAYREPRALVVRALEAACAIRGVHHTWLLDDGADPELAALARRLGAGYLTRTDRTDAKAGNINAALARTTGDVVAIFDVDHAPTPDFLERTLGYFRDPACGFAQVMLTFSNGHESWVARAATESALDFYNATTMGMDGVGSATLVGSNAVLRRAALASIGGYRPGLAEDLATSIALHAAGWRSVYVAEPLAPGLAPPDLHAWFVQQLKWARGVFEVLLTDYPRFFPRLTWGERLAYGVRMTYYGVGVFACAHLLATLVLLLGGTPGARMRFQDYLLHMLPLVTLFFLIRLVAMVTWHHPTVQVRAQWRAIALVFATWPIYTVAFAMAVLRLPLGFRLTPKTRAGTVNPLWLAPQVLALFLLGVGIINTGFATARPPLLLLAFAFTQGVLQAVLIRHCIAARDERRPNGGATEDAWMRRSIGD